MQTDGAVQIYYASDGASLAEQLQSELAKKLAKVTITPIAEMAHAPPAVKGNISALTAIVWSRNASLEPSRGIVASSNLGGREVWIILLEGAVFSDLPASLRFCRQIDVGNARGGQFLAACERIALLSEVRERAKKPASVEAIQQMIASRSIRVRIPGPAGTPNCNIATAVGLVPLEKPPSTQPSSPKDQGSGGATPTPLRLSEAIERVQRRTEDHSIEHYAALAGYVLGAATIVGAAMAWRAEISDLMTRLGVGTQGLTLVPTFLTQRRASMDDAVFLAASCEPIIEGRTTIHIDLLSSRQLPASVRIEGRKADLATEKPIGSVMFPIRQHETIVLGLLADGLIIGDGNLRDHQWTGAHVHMSFDVAVPPGETRTKFRPELVVRTERCEPTLVHLDIGPDLDVLRRLISDIAYGLSGNIFISYSHHTPLDDQIAHFNKRLWKSITGLEVFLDVDSIPSANPWRATIEAALDETILLVLIWSWDASRSAEVAKEIAVACRMRDNGRRIDFDIVGVADDRGKYPPLPECLTQYHMRFHPVHTIG